MHGRREDWSLAAASGDLVHPRRMRPSPRNGRHPGSDRYFVPTRGNCMDFLKVGGESGESAMEACNVPSNVRRESISSVMSRSECESEIASGIMSAGEQVRVGMRERVKVKRKRAEGAREREVECMSEDDLEQVRRIGQCIREGIFKETNKVSKTMCEFIMTKVAEYEFFINKMIAKNERLKGQLSGMREYRKEYMKGEGVDMYGVSIGMSEGRGRVCGHSEGSVGKRSYAVVVRGNDMNSEQVKESVLTNVKPVVNVRVKAVRKVRNGGVAIETVSEKERDVLTRCPRFQKAGLKVELPKKIGPKVIVYDVPIEVSDKVFLNDLYERNLKDVIGEDVFRERVRIKSRSGKKGASVSNLIVEMNVRACESVVKNGRLYIDWHAFRVKKYESVRRCYACYGFGHVMNECKIGKICRKCGDKTHVMKDCKARNESCMNCKMKGVPDEHSMLSDKCPQFVSELERMRARIHYE